MKVALIVPGFSASETDWCIPAHLNLVRRLSTRVEVHVFPLRYPPHRRHYRVGGATVHSQGGAGVRGAERIALLRRTVAAVMAEHRSRPFDVLHAIWVDEPGFVAVIAGLLLDVPAVLSLFGGELVRLPDIGYGGQLSRLNRWFVRAALRGAARVTAGSSYLRRLARPWVAPHRLLPLPIGVDTGLFHPGDDGMLSPPLAELAGHVKLLHAASLVAIKDQATLLRAMSRVAKEVRGVHLHILGEGPLRRELEALAGSLGIAPHVSFHGAVAHEKMPAYYRAADLCVMSSRHEGQELVTLEAAACGRATVGTAVGVLPDLAPPECIVPVGDHEVLAETLTAMLREPERLAALGRVCREKVEANYTLERTIRELLDLYAEI